jgi:NTE family protein
MKFYILSFCFLLIVAFGFSQQKNIPRPKVGLVLSGGGAKGLAHIGVLKVLEEAGVPIDYIGGTSMGSIIGGLYAIGYRSDELSRFVTTMNWDSLLTDQIDRQNLSFEEKEENARYFVSFPIREKRIGLPSGAIGGQNIYGLFNKMASPVYRERDFTKFPIPFICVATDIEKAEATVLKSGYLPQAMRASMAIPTIFTPENIDGNMYVDGGVLSNFPVLEVKDMGADILIGVDVGFRAQPKKMLNTIPGILSQSMYTFTKSELNKNRSACDILIDPDLVNYNLMNYDKADSIIARGEAAARAMLPRLKALVDSLNTFTPLPPKASSFQRFDTIYVKEVEITGLNVVPREFVYRKLQLEIPSKLSFKELDDKIALLFGTQFFNKVTYRLEPLPEGAKIILEIDEKNTNYFKVGIHYDTDFKTALLLNSTFRNLLIPGSKLSLDLAIGENIAFNGLLYLNTGWNSEKIQARKKQLFPDFGVRLNSHKMEVYEYNKDRIAASYDFFDVTLDLFYQWNLSNNNALGGGVMGDYTNISNRVGTANFPISDYLYSNFHLFYKIDNYNKSLYPTRGIQLTSNISYVKGLVDKVNSEMDFFQGNVRFSNAVPLSKRLTLTNMMFAGFSSTDIIPAHYSYFLGGLGGTYLRGLVPIVGLKYMQISGSNAWALGTDLRFEAWPNNFFSIKGNVSKAAVAAKDLITTSGITIGGGVSFGYKSVIGPMEISFMSSNNIKGLAGFVNIGYWF